MGSKSQQRKRTMVKRAEPNEPSYKQSMSETSGLTTPIPDLNDVDVAFGNARHLPKYELVPEQFKSFSNPYVRFVSSWFFGGRTQEDMQRLKERPGVDRKKAFMAIKACLGSFEPKHEHKEAGCAFLLSEWFEFADGGK